MYIWKFKTLCIRNQKKASEVIGVTRQYLCNICAQRININKRLAYFITKYIDSDAEIEDYFKRIG